MFGNRMKRKINLLNTLSKHDNFETKFVLN
jgi:hypothetical protein